MSDYDFGQSRKEKYVGKGTGSIITTPNPRRGYTKSGSPRMKISEKNTWRREVDYGIQQAKAGVAEAKEGSRQAQEAINAINAMGAEKSVEPTSHEIFRAVRRLEDNPGLHQAYVGKASGSQSQKARKLKMWDGSIKGDFPREK
jgi:hypothetical protein